MYPENTHLERVAQAFTHKAKIYDEFGRDHPNLERMRQKVYEHIFRFAEPQAHILEINAGTGWDAAYLACRGYFVHATDISPGMIAAIFDKIIGLNLDEKLTAERCSFTDLSRVQGAPFDFIFSNFGGLNCVQDLSLIREQLPWLLKPGGRLTWVIMPPVCLWDLALVVKGEFRRAFRRLRPAGTLAHVEGVAFQVHYFTPAQVLHSLGKEYRILRLEGLSIFAPPADRKHFAGRYPKVFQLLTGLDRRVAARWPFYQLGDFYILSVEYHP